MQLNKKYIKYNMRYDSDDEIDISKYVRHREDFIEYKINKYKIHSRRRVSPAISSFII